MQVQAEIQWKRCGGGSNDSWPCRPHSVYKYNHKYKCEYQQKYNHKYKQKYNGKGVVGEAMIAGPAGLIPGPSGFLLQ